MQGIKTKYFGVLTEITGKEEEWIELNNYSLNELKTFLKDTYPDFRSVNYRFAINQELVNEDALLKEGQEVVLLPPYSGG